MSAIAGVVRADGRDLDPDLPQRLRAATPFLGREGVDEWREGPAALLRFALRVTPQSLNERQPCRHPSGALLVMDGRLDNRRRSPPGWAPRRRVAMRPTRRWRWRR